jgi:hypothetical protein
MSNLLGVDEALPPSEFLDNPSGFVKLATDGVMACRDCGAGVSPVRGSRDGCTTNWATTCQFALLADNFVRRDFFPVTIRTRLR